MAIPIVAQQQPPPPPQRERRVAPAGERETNSDPGPSPAVAPTHTTTDETPTAFRIRLDSRRARIRQAATTRTLPELQARISQILQKTELAPAMVGIKVASLDTGRVLFEENANKLLRPASNMKLYTVAAALDRLSPDYRFVTSVYAAASLMPPAWSTAT